MQNKATPPSSAQASATAEIKALQREVAALRNELGNELKDFRAELNKKLLNDASDLIAVGVLKAGAVLFVISLVLQFLFARN